MPSLRLVLLSLLVAHPACAENLVRNGDFSAGAEHWNLRLAAGHQASLVINEGEASILIVAGGSSRWTINLEQTFAAPFRQGVTYTISFDLRADTPRAIDAVLRARSGNILGASYRVPADPKIRRETFTYTHKEADGEAKLAFRLGGESTAIAIDNVVVEPAPALPAPASAEAPSAPAP